MKFRMTFNYRPPGQDEPYDAVQDDWIDFEEGDPAIIPAVGDTVDIKWGGEQKYFKVVSRHFSYGLDFRGVNMVIIDTEPGEMEKRVADI